MTKTVEVKHLDVQSSHTSGLNVYKEFQFKLRVRKAAGADKINVDKNVADGLA